MAEKPYSKREIDNIVIGLKDQITGFEKDTRESLARIEIQTTQHNGRMKRLELWQAYVFGFCACLSLMLLSILIPAAFAYFP